MATVASLYNKLPTLEEADSRFTDRLSMLEKLRGLLAAYNHVYGLCLIHAHCNLAEGEIMLAQGDTSQPEKVASLEDYYPERWLSSGEPYEFTSQKTVDPPADLLKSFSKLVGNIGVLGLYYIGVESESGGKVIERTEGRKNIVSPYDDPDAAQLGGLMETAWNLGRGDPVTMTCVIYCDTLSTRSGGTHKGSKSHIPQ